MNRKHYTVSLKDINFSDEGKGQVVFATLNQIDKDGDLTLPGAFGKQLAHLLPMHVWQDASTPFLGVASISERGNEAIADIELNLELQRAKDWRSSLKFALDHGKTIEWSYGFDITDSEMKTENGRTYRVLKALTVFEVSPVVIGAGNNTRTLTMKSGEKAYADLSGTWEAAQDAIREAARTLLIGDRDGWVSIEGTYNTSVIVSAYFYDEQGGEACYRFDWTMNADGTVTLSNQQTVDLQLVVVQKNVKLAEQWLRIPAELRSFTTRLKALAALRQKEGRTLSRANWERLDRLNSQLQTLQSDVADLLATTAPASDADVSKSAINPDELYAQYLHVQSQLKGHIPSSN